MLTATDQTFNPPKTPPSNGDNETAVREFQDAVSGPHDRVCVGSISAHDSFP